MTGADYKVQLQDYLSGLSRLQWAIADLINEGRARFKEQAKAAYKQQDTFRLEQWGRTARRITKETRNPSLSFEHHLEVADLPAHKQKAWLRLALKENLSPKELRIRIRRAGALPRDPSKPVRIPVNFKQHQTELVLIHWHD